MKNVCLLALIPLVALTAACTETRNPVAASAAVPASQTQAASVAAGVGASSAPQGVAAGKVKVCHVNGTGSFQLISVSANAWPAHQAHGDGQPSGPVPGGAGSVFDAACVPQAVPVPTYTVGGNTSGLAGTGLVLRNNGGDDLSISGNGAFTFSTPVASGQPYNVTIAAQPGGQACAVSPGTGTGTIASANVTTVVVTCATNTYTIGGTVSGLTGSGLVLRNNGGDDLSISGSGAFTFSTPVASGQPYNVTIAAQPADQTCTITADSGVVASADVTSVVVTCPSVVASKRAFVSSSTFPANFGGYSAADAACQSLGSAAGLGGTWMAWLSDNNSSPAVRFTQSTGPYRRVDGTLIAASWADLTDGSLINGVTTNEYGVPVPNAEVWTATSPNGSYTGSSCNNFTSNSNGAPYSAVGISDRSNVNWTYVYLQFCDRTGLRLYCFQQ